MSFKLDRALAEYATERQLELLRAWEELGSSSKAAKKLGVHEKTIRNAITRVKQQAARRGYAPEHDLTHPVPAGLTLRGTSIRYDELGAIDQYWNKTKPEGRPEEETVQLDAPVHRTATLFDQEGKVTQQWVTRKRKDEEKANAWRVFADELIASVPKFPLIPIPVTCGHPPVYPELMTCYPVGDHHIGMLAWDKEVGDDYDVKIAERLLSQSIEHLVAIAPTGSAATVVFLGDFLHYDGWQPLTPTNRNLLDSDSRFPKMVRVAVRCMRHAIETAAAKHSRVHVIVEIGNHDLASSVFLMEILRALYENNPRITVDTSPRHYHYFEFGRCLVGVHHGHGAKLDQLPVIMATDVPELWGRTSYRYIWTGHVHNDRVKDIHGCRVESFRVLPPTDAWANQQGYRSMREMKSIVLHKEFGEIARNVVNPSMFQKDEK